MNPERSRPMPELRVNRQGIVVGGNDEATRAFGESLEGADLAGLIKGSGNGGAEWRGLVGPFAADVFAIATDPEGIELRLVPASRDSRPSRERHHLLEVATDLARATRNEMDHVVVDALGRIGRMSGVDRAYLFVWTEDGRCARNTHEWTRAGVAPQIVSLQRLDREQLEWLESAMVRDGHLLIRSLDEIPDGEGTFRAVLEDGQIRSLLCIPLFREGELAGFVGFDSVTHQTHWSGSSVERLTLVSELLIQSILRAGTERDLAETSEVFHLVRIATNDVIWDWDVVTGRIERSESLESMLGFSPGSETETPEWWMERVHPDDRREVAIDLETPIDDVHQHEYRIRHRDGHWIHVLDRGHVIRDENGKPVRMVGMTTDITDRITTVRKLRESDARFRAVVENISDVITIVDRCGMVVYASPAASGTFGYSTIELIGTDMFERIHPDDHDRVRELLRRAIDDGRSREQTTLRFRHGLGHWITLETVVLNMLADETIRGIVLVSRDITSRQRMERQLERANRLAGLGHLASSVAHEFNNALMGAQPFVDLIRRTEDLDRIRTAAAKIQNALDRGKSISRSVLQLSRPLNVALETIDLRTWIDSIGEEIRRALPATISLEIEPPDQAISVVADPDALYQALFNLILRSKAGLEAQPSGSIRIMIRSASEKDYLEMQLDEQEDYGIIVLRDDGPTLDAEALEHPFDPKHSSSSGPSAGLGLAVAYQLIAAQKGVVGITGDEAGSIVKICLRSATKEAGSMSTRLDRPDDERLVRAERTILLIEDDEIVASGIVALLELEGQKVQRAATGMEGLARLEEFVPAVVILDIGLPDMSGVEVFEKIETAYPNLPVIFSSGHGDQSEIREYLERPDIEFLLKPYDAATLLSIVERILTRKERRRGRDH